AEPTVPKRMVLPCTLPVMLGSGTGFESLIVPCKRDPDSVQWRVNVPGYAPPYFPFHVPESEPPAARAMALLQQMAIAAATGRARLIRGSLRRSDIDACLLMVGLPQPSVI